MARYGAKMKKEQTVRLLTRLDWRLAPSQPLVNMNSGFFIKSFRQRKNSKAFELHPISWTIKNPTYGVQLIFALLFCLRFNKLGLAYWR